MRDPSRNTVLLVIVCGTVFVLGYLLGAANTRRAAMRATAPPPAAGASTAAPPPAPRLQARELVHDFGTIAHDGTLRFAFRLTNTGSADLVFGSVEAACGCTVATLSSPTLAPGAATDLAVTFDAKGQHGQVDKEIEVESNDPAAPVTVLRLTGRVLEAGEATPAPAPSGTAAR